ncbi:MAG: hypothetical protein ACOZCO_08610 [Bacteroidota bacterium]
MSKWRKKHSFGIIILCIVLLFVLAYFQFKKFVVEQPINTFQFHQLFIMSISAVLTLGAIIVALFKEQLFSIFKYPILIVDSKYSDAISASFAQSEGGGKATIEKYDSIFTVHNNGNISVEGCKIQLQELSFQGEGAVKSQTIDISNAVPIKWNSDSLSEIMIHPHQKAIVSILQITVGEKKSTPQDGQSPISILNIGGIIANDQYKKGTWKVSFIILSKNCPVYTLKFTISWDGQWRESLEEMKKIVSIEIEKMDKKKKSK